MPLSVSALARAALVVIGLTAHAVSADVVSKTLVFLQADGEHFLTQRSLRSDASQHRFHVEKNLTQDQLSYVDPNQYEWDQSTEESNILTFSQGDFSVMYPGRFDAPALTQSDDGIYIYRSWDGHTREDGHFGMWHEPGDFTRFNYAWIFPHHFEIVDFESNRDGTWVERSNSLSFFAEDVNDLTFIIRYREKDGDNDGVADRSDHCPDTLEDAVVDTTGCEPDTDGDGVIDRMDNCVDTPIGAAVNQQGCQPDRDGDGIADTADLCGKTPADIPVDSDGCSLDTDADGIGNHNDRCPNSPAGVVVNSKGCAPDFDGDGISYIVDQCRSTPAGRVVDGNGCQLDRDTDGVVDELDQCPDSAPGAEVNRQGCEIDCDADGIVNSMDHCPRTPAGRIVDANGCELDADADGIVDALDQCPSTPPGRTVDTKGCELDDDGDGVVNAADLCPSTPAGAPVNSTGCVDRDAIRLEGVQFMTDSAQLTEASLTILARVAGTLRQHSYLELEVAGHTDSQGAAGYNLDLSQRRAETVRKYLLDSGVSLQKLVAKGYGEEQPLADNATAGGRALNRRVELKRLDD